MLTYETPQIRKSNKPSDPYYIDLVTAEISQNKTNLASKSVTAFPKMPKTETVLTQHKKHTALAK